MFGIRRGAIREDGLRSGVGPDGRVGLATTAGAASTPAAIVAAAEALEATGVLVGSGETRS